MKRILPGLHGAPRVLVGAVAFTVIAIGATFLLDPYRNFQFATIAGTFCATAGLTLLIGWGGQLSLGHAALMASGGYGYALAATALDEAGVDGPVRFALSMLAAMVVSGVLGVLLGLAAGRLRGPYLAGVTLALVIALPAVASVASPVLGGDQGLRAPWDPVPPALERLIAPEQWQAWVAIVVTAVVVTGLTFVRRGRLGVNLRAVRDDELGARVSGVAAGRATATIFTVSAVAAGAGGGVLCFVTSSVSPGGYTLAFSLLLVVAVVVGGLGSIGGAALGAALIVLLPWAVGAVTSSLGLPADVEQRLTGNLAVLVFGVLLVVVMLLWPRGLAGVRLRRASSDRVASTTAPRPRRPAESAPTAP